MAIKAKPQTSVLSKLFAPLYNSKATQDRYNEYAQALYLKDLQNSGKFTDEAALNKFFAENVNNPSVMSPYTDATNTLLKTASANPLKGNLGLEGNFKDMTGRGTTLDVLGTNIKAHPLQATALGASAAGNIAGLFDNDKIGGQLAGTALGVGANAIIPAITGSPLGSYAKVMIPMVAGNIGALFDKLRSKKAEEEAQQYGQY